MSSDSARKVRRALAGDRSVTVTRAYPLDDIHVRSGGTGRDVVAYAAVFMVPSEIVDRDGHYKEQNRRTAFDRSIADRRNQIFSVYNHARSLDGTPSDMWSVPLGAPLEIKPDQRGLLTITRFDPGEANDRILEAIKSGALRGMSYTGVFLRSDPELDGPYAQYGPSRSGELPLVTREEIALIEYGPTPIPAFETAEVIGVRARERMPSREQVILNGAGRGGMPVHHTDISMASFDPEAELGKVKFPTSWDHMKSLYALADEAAGDNTSGYGKEAGHLPHHHVNDDGTPGPANLEATRNALMKADTVDGFTTEEKLKAKAHLNAHLEDVGSSVSDDKDLPPLASSSGRDGDDPTSRAVPSMDGDDGPDTSVATHGTMTGTHAHNHRSYGGPDGNSDGMHGHEHTHQGDARHDHAHPAGTNGRTDDEPDTSSRAAGVDDSPWDAQKVWTKGTSAQDPGAFFRAVCAGRKNGDSKLQSTWALPHHYEPGKPPNKAGVEAALRRLNQTQGLVNQAQARAHLEAHARVIESTKDDTKESSSNSGRKPAASAASRQAGTGTGGPAVPHGPQPHPAVTNEPSRSLTMADYQMTIDQRQIRLAEVQHRLQEIDSENMGAELPADTRAEWTDLQRELVDHQRAIKDASERAAYLRTILENPDAPGTTEGLDNTGIGYGGVYGTDGSYTTGPSARTQPTYRTVNGNGSPLFYNPMNERQIFDLAAIRNKANSFEQIPDLYRQHAMRAIEVVRYGGPKTREDCQETVANLLDRIDDDQGTLARRVLVTGSPLYDRAFGKMLGSLSTNGLAAEESRALQLGVDSAGGYAVPFQLDPTVILSSNGAINPLRQIARVEQITGKEWDGVTSAGVVVNRVAEGTEAGTGDPLFVQPNVRTTRVQGFVPFNIELDVSWGALRSQMTSLLMDAKDIEEASSFALGNGTAPQANGVIGTMPAGSFVNTAGTATLAIGDLYNLENNMAPRFRQQSAYLASKTTFNRFRQLFQALASAAFDSWVRPSAGTPATFNGYPAYELSTMTTTITSGSQVLLQGDFSQFLIVDRVGMGIELIPHLFGPTNRYPVGQRGILAIWFNNSRILVPNAFRLLQTL